MRERIAATDSLVAFEKAASLRNSTACAIAMASIANTWIPGRSVAPSFARLSFHPAPRARARRPHSQRIARNNTQRERSLDPQQTRWVICHRVQFELDRSIVEGTTTYLTTRQKGIGHVPCSSVVRARWRNPPPYVRAAERRSRISDTATSCYRKDRLVLPAVFLIFQRLDARFDIA